MMARKAVLLEKDKLVKLVIHAAAHNQMYTVKTAIIQ